MLDPVSRPCIRTAYVLYGGILDAVADEGYAVVHRRAVVPRRRRAAVALDGIARVMAARVAARSGEAHDAPTASPLRQRPTTPSRQAPFEQDREEVA
jgi:phytoene synthase